MMLLCIVRIVRRVCVVYASCDDDEWNGMGDGEVEPSRQTTSTASSPPVF